MKQKSIIIIVGVLLLTTGCSINNELDKELESKVTRITASDASKKTRTTALSGNRVTWAENDALGLIKVTDKASNNHFRLTQGAGEIDGIFEAAETKDALDAGTWVAYYPYTATRYTSSRKFRMVSMTQTDDTPSHLARYDWLLSNPVTLSSGNPDNDFKLNHLFSLIEFNVKLENSSSKYLELAQCVLESVDNTNTFAQYTYFNDQGDVTFDYTSKNVSISRYPYVEFTTNYTTLWLVARQSELKPLSVRVYFTYGSVISSASTSFTPTSKLEPGNKYVLYLQLEVNEANPNASTLSLLPPNL